MITAHLTQKRVVGIDKDESVGASHLHKIIEFGLGPHHPFKTAEALQMCFPHIGDESKIRLCDVDERADVARMTRSHLHNSQFVFAGKPQQRLGYTYIIIEIALGKEHVILFGQHGRYQFLGGCLAVGTRYADNRRAECTPMIIGQLLECFQTVVYEDKSRVFNAATGRVFVDNGIRTALLQSLFGKVIAIERCAFQCEKDTSFGAIAAVGRDRRVSNEQFVKF